MTEYKKLAKSIYGIDEQMKGPGDKKKTDSALARDGAISQQPEGQKAQPKSPFQGVGPGGSMTAAGGGVGTAAKPQVGNEPSPKEDEYEKDIETISMPMFLQAKSLFGKQVVAAFGQDHEPPEPEEPEEEEGKETPDEVAEGMTARQQRAAGAIFRKSPRARQQRAAGAIFRKSPRARQQRAAGATFRGEVIDQMLGELYKGDGQTVTSADGEPIKVPEKKFREAQKTEPTQVVKMPVPFTVQTKEGPAEGEKGDYLAKGVEGEMWPIDKEIFHKTHEFVREGVISEDIFDAAIDAVNNYERTNSNKAIKLMAKALLKDSHGNREEALAFAKDQAEGYAGASDFWDKLYELMETGKLQEVEMKEANEPRPGSRVTKMYRPDMRAGGTHAEGVNEVVPLWKRFKVGDRVVFKGNFGNPVPGTIVSEPDSGMNSHTHPEVISRQAVKFDDGSTRWPPVTRLSKEKKGVKEANEPWRAGRVTKMYRPDMRAGGTHAVADALQKQGYKAKAARPYLITNAPESVVVRLSVSLGAYGPDEAKVGMKRSGGKVEWGREKGKQRRASHKRVRKQAKQSSKIHEDVTGPTLAQVRARAQQLKAKSPTRMMLVKNLRKEFPGADETIIRTAMHEAAAPRQDINKRVDIRKIATQKKQVKDGVLYRYGRVLQVWWRRDSLGRPMPKGKEQETWTIPNTFGSDDYAEQEAKKAFKELSDRLNESVVNENRQTEPQRTPGAAKRLALKMGFGRNGYYVMGTPDGWVAIEYLGENVVTTEAEDTFEKGLKIQSNFPGEGEARHYKLPNGEIGWAARNKKGVLKKFHGKSAALKFRNTITEAGTDIRNGQYRVIPSGKLYNVINTRDKEKVISSFQNKRDAQEFAWSMSSKGEVPDKWEPKEGVVTEAGTKNFEVNAVGDGWSYSSIVNAPNQAAAEKQFMTDKRFRRMARQNGQSIKDVELLTTPVKVGDWTKGGGTIPKSPGTSRSSYQKRWGGPQEAKGPGSSKKGFFDSPSGDDFFKSIQKGAKGAKKKGMSPQDALAKFNADRLKKKGITKSEDAEPNSLSHGGNIGAPINPSHTDRGRGQLTQQELDSLDKNWKEILKVAKKVFTTKPTAVANRVIEKLLEKKYGIENLNSGTITQVIAKVLKQDYSPKSKAWTKAHSRTAAVSGQGSGHIPMRYPPMHTARSADMVR